MKQILIIGLGRFGLHVAKKLNEMHTQVLGVDSSEERVKAALPYVTNAEIGDAGNQEFLKSLGISNFDVCSRCGSLSGKISRKPYRCAVQF